MSDEILKNVWVDKCPNFVDFPQLWCSLGFSGMEGSIIFKQLVCVWKTNLIYEFLELIRLRSLYVDKYWILKMASPMV